MNRLEEITIDCPWCAERIELLVDGSVEAQRYVEDCSVCCRPIVVDVSVSDETGIQVGVQAESR